METRVALSESDRLLAEAARKKLAAGGTPSRAEAAALARKKAADEENVRWHLLRTVPQKTYREMAGRQTKVLQEQAARYGLPCAGKTIDLVALVRAVHDFLAANAKRLAAADELGRGSPALERFREEQAAKARLERERLEGRLMAREVAHERLTYLATLLRACGERLERQCGATARELLDQTLVEFQREVARAFTGDPAGNPGGDDDRAR